MPVPSELLAAARNYQTSAAVSLLESYYPVTHRLAYALSGDAAIGEGIIRQVMKRALSLLPRWRDETLPDRWFYHHTVLATRSAAHPSQKNISATDPLIPPVATAAYVAFIRTLRSLPPQQCEAIVLHYGERLNARFLGIAMDCSANAASTHFTAATESLGAMAGESFDALLRELGTVYRGLSPSPAAVTALRGRVSSFVWPRRVWRWIYRIATLAILITIGLLAWHFRHLMPYPSTNPTTQ